MHWLAIEKLCDYLYQETIVLSEGVTDMTTATNTVVPEARLETLRRQRAKPAFVSSYTGAITLQAFNSEGKLTFVILFPDVSYVLGDQVGPITPCYMESDLEVMVGFQLSDCYVPLRYMRDKRCDFVETLLLYTQCQFTTALAKEPEFARDATYASFNNMLAYVSEWLWTLPSPKSLPTTFIQAALKLMK